MVFSATSLISSPPRYQQVGLALRQRITEGAYSGASPMPGERELAREFGVGRVTVRTALARLEADGLVIRRRGKGTVPVQRAEGPSQLPVRGGLIDYLLSMGVRTHARVLDHVVCPAPLAAAVGLRLELETPVLKVVRIREFEGHPISYTEAYIPREYEQFVPRQALRESQMVALLEANGIKITFAEQTLSAALADPVAAVALELPQAVPLLKVTRVAMAQSGKPVQYFVGLYHPDRYEYHMRLSRVGRETNVWVESESDRT